MEEIKNDSKRVLRHSREPLNVLNTHYMLLPRKRHRDSLTMRDAFPVSIKAKLPPKLKKNNNSK